MPLPKNANSIVNFARDCQNEDGGFANWPKGVSYMECCFHSMVLLNLLNSVDQIDRNGILTFIEKRINKDGGFADFPGQPSTLFNTFYGIVCLNILRRLDLINKNSTVNYLKSKQRIRGGFYHEPTYEPDMIATFWAIISAVILQATDEFDMEGGLSFIESCRNQDGGFGSAPSQPAYMEYTFQALTILRLLGIKERKDQIDKTILFVSSSQAKDGRFGERPNVPPTVGDTMWAVSVCSILDSLLKINTHAILNFIETTTANDLWSSHCMGVCYHRTISSDIIVRPRLFDVQLYQTNKDHMLAFYTFDQNQPSKPAPELIAIESESLRTVNQFIEEVDDTIYSIDDQGGNLDLYNFSKPIRDIGELIADSFWTNSLCKNYSHQEQAFTNFSTMEDLVGIPWELTYVDGEHVGLRHSVAKFIANVDVSSSASPTIPITNLSILAIGNPSVGSSEDSLPAAESEVRDLSSYLKQNSRFNIIILSGEDVSRKNLLTTLNEKGPFDIIHFAGHAYFSIDNPLQSGLILADGKLEARILCERLRRKPPQMVFFNACNTAKIGPKKYGFQNQLYGLAKHFLELGTSYVGTYWPIFDDSSRHFSRWFYIYLMNGFPIGESLRLARWAVLTKYEGLGITWASYTMFGNPMRRLTNFEFLSGSGR